MRAPIRRHRSCHADMHGKREAAQVIGATMSALGRMLAARFDLLPSCTTTPHVRAVSSLAVANAHMLLLPIQSSTPNAPEHGRGAWIGLRLSGDSPAASRPCRSDAAPADVMTPSRRRNKSLINRLNLSCFARQSSGGGSPTARHLLRTTQHPRACHHFDLSARPHVSQLKHISVT